MPGNEKVTEQGMTQDQSDPVEALIDRIAEAVVRKIDERDKIDAIAQAVLARMEEQDAAATKTTRTPSRKAAKAKTKAKAKRPSRSSAKKAKPR